MAETHFSAQVVAAVKVPEGLPWIPRAEIVLPVAASANNEGFSVNFAEDNAVMEFPGAPDLAAFDFSLKGSRDSGILVKLTDPETGNLGQFYVDGPTWSSCIDLFGKILEQQKEMFSGAIPSDDSLRQQIDDAIVELIEDPENPAPQAQLQTLLTQALMPLFSLKLKSIEDGQATYAVDLFSILPAACHRLADLAPWDAIEFLMDGAGDFELSMLQKMRRGDLANYQALGAAMQKIAKSEFLSSCVAHGEGKLFFTDFSWEIQFQDSVSIEVGCQDLKEALKYFLPLEAVEPMQIAPMLMGFAGAELSAGYRMKGLDLSPIADGSFDVTEAEIANAEDYSPMVAGFLPMLEMAMEQQFGGGFSGEEEF